MAVLDARGTPRALVAIGGDLVAGRAPPGVSGWTVRIASDSSSIVVVHSAVSTSGDAEQFVEIGGVRYSHVVDPRTGVGLTTGVTVTVQAPTGAQADAWATAVAVLDDARRAAFVAMRPDASFVVRGAGDAVHRNPEIPPCPLSTDTSSFRREPFPPFATR
jgi:thiamine biosynthesis lipoprotein